MPHLIPEKRVDRNGRLVTKHVRSAPVGASTASSLPAPTPAQSVAVVNAEQRFKWFIEESQRRGIAPHAFVKHYGEIDEEYKDSPYLYDAVEFKAAGFDKGGGELTVCKEILKGNVAFSDLKTIGLEKLKDKSRAYNLLVALEAVNKGEAEYTVDDLRGLTDRSIAEDATEMEFSTAVDTVYNLGIESINGVPLTVLDAKHYYYFRSEHSESQSGVPRKDVFKRMAYAAQVRVRVGRRMDDAFITDEFCDAGIPLEVTADVLRVDGTLAQAKAIHEEGIQSGISGGWL